MHRRDWRSPAAWLVPGVLARPPAGARRGDAAAAGRRDRRAAPREEVDAGVEAVAAGPEAVADGDAQRPGEPQQRARGRTPQGGEGHAPGEAVGAESRPRLEALQR